MKRLKYIFIVLILLSRSATANTETVHVVSGNGASADCSQSTELALAAAKARASEKCANYQLISTRYSPNSPSNACGMDANGQQVRTVILRVKCSNG